MASKQKIDYWDPYEIAEEILEENIYNVHEFTLFTKALSNSYHAQHKEQQELQEKFKDKRRLISSLKNELESLESQQLEGQQLESKLQQLKQLQEKHQQLIQKHMEILNEMQLPQLPQNTVLKRSFLDLRNRCAYMYLYFPFHAFLLRDEETFQEVGKKKIFKSLEELDEIQLCSIGGCPGTEFFSLAQQIKRPIHGSVLEFYTEWQKMFETIKEKIPSTLQQYIGDVKYLRFNYFAKITDELIKEVKKADLVTMVKFLSIFYDICQSGLFQEQLRSILKSMKEGAKLIVIDNSRGCFLDVFKGFLGKCDYLKEVFPCKDYEFTAEPESRESLKNLQRDYGYLQDGYNPQETGKVYIGVFEKKSTSAVQASAAAQENTPQEADDSQPMEM